MSKDNRGRSAHADGGAAGVKRRFSLAARHRFFGQAPKKWGRMAGQGNDYLPTYRRTRTKRRKRGNPRRGFPLRPPPALMRAQGSSALCGARARAPPLHPATFEKVDETFKRASRSAHEMRPPVRGPRVGGRAVGSMPGAGVMASSPAGAAAAAIAGAAARSAFFIVSYFPERQHYRREDDQPHEQRRPVLSYPFKHLP